MMRLLPLFAVLSVLAATACSDSPKAGDDDPTAADAQPAARATNAPAGTPAAGELAAAIRGVEIPSGLADGKALGSADAPVTLTMFEDFQCPFCLRFTGQDEPVIIDEYVKEGLVRLEFRHFPVLRGESILAAVASECAAEQDHFWEYHEELFAIQADAGQDLDEKLNQGRFTVEALDGIAESVELDMEAYEACVLAPETLAAVQEDETAAREAGLNGTPNFLVTIGDETAPLPPAGGDPGGPAEWRALLDALLEIAESVTPVPGPTP